MRVFFLLLFWSAAAVGQEPDGTPKIPTAEEYCEAAYAVRLEPMRAVGMTLLELPDTPAWMKMSRRQRERLRTPLVDKLEELRANRQMDRNFQWPLDTEVGDVFTLEGTAKNLLVNDDWKIERIIDDHSVLAYTQKRGVDGIRRGVPVRIVIEGLQPTEFGDKPKAALQLSGMWYRRDNLKLGYTPYVRIARWPHEEAVKKRWPEFLKQKESTTERDEFWHREVGTGF